MDVPDFDPECPRGPRLTHFWQSELRTRSMVVECDWCMWCSITRPGYKDPRTKWDDDMAQQIGTKHHAAKMNPAKVRQARKSYEVRLRDGSRKWTKKALARKYGITPQSMNDILTNKTWKHVS